MNAVEGFVLTGGASRRYGSDKALAVVDGRRMAESVVAALQSGGIVTVRTVGGPDRGLTVGDSTVGHLADLYPGEGPLGGLLTALAGAGEGTEWICVVATDLPTLDGATVAKLLADRGREADVVVAFTGRTEPLCAVWNVGVTHPVARAAFAEGVRDMHTVLDRLNVRATHINESQVHNVNRPSDHLSFLP